MRRNDRNVDLRMLSLLYALGDKEEFMQELQKLKEAGPVDDESWDQICQMGRDLALEDSLFNPPADVSCAPTVESAASRQARRIESDRRQQGRRMLCRRIKTDRRQQDRRASTLLRLEIEQRKRERRQFSRRHTDPGTVVGFE